MPIADRESQLQALAELEERVLDAVGARAPQVCPAVRDEQVLTVCPGSKVQAPSFLLQDSLVPHKGLAHVASRISGSGRGVAVPR